MHIVEKKTVPGLAHLYLAQVRENPAKYIEFVDTVVPGTPREKKWVIIISTQIGCPVRCLMCDAGLRFQGNLTAEEMIAQVEYVLQQYPEKDTARAQKIKVHFARMGEPSLNPATIEALRSLRALIPTKNLVACLSSVAPTTPLARQFFEDLLKIKNELFPGDSFQLQFSLHTTNEQQRDRFIPIPKWSFADIAAYGKRFVRPENRRITLNFALAQDNEFSPRVLAQNFSPEHFLIKITPINSTIKSRSNAIASMLPDFIRRSVLQLQKLGFSVVPSPSTQEELDAAVSCGQLWSTTLRNQQHEALAH